MGCIVAALGFVLYAGTINHGYVLDDVTVITNNKITKQGLGAIPALLHTAYWNGYNGSHDWTYRPLSMIMFAVEWQFFPDNPHVSHFINILLYGLTGFLLFFTLAKVLADYKQRGIIISFVASLLFMAHPIHTEVVSNIKSRDEILCFLFILSSVYYLCSYVTKFDFFSAVKIFAAACCFFLALLSKENAITFLGVFPFILWLFYKTPFLSGKNMVAMSAFMIVAGIYFIIRFQILHGFSGDEQMPVINNTLIAAPDVASRFSTATYILGIYMKLLFFPYPLSWDYSYSQIPLLPWSDYRAIISLLVYLGIGVFALMNIQKNRMLSFGIIFYLITLSPVSNVFILIGSTMAERFLYMPSLGFCLVIAALLAKYTSRETVTESIQSVTGLIKSYMKLWAVLFFIIVLYSFKTVSRSKNWKSDLALYSQDVNTSSNSARVLYNYAITLYNEKTSKEKDETLMNNMLDDIIGKLEKAVKIYLDYPEAYLALGLAYYKKNNFVKAIENYELAQKYKPEKNPENLNDMGLLYSKTGQYDKAIDCLEMSVKLKPDFADGFNNLGYAYICRQEYRKAAEAFNKSIQINPQNIGAWKNLGSTYGTLKDYDAAITCFKKAIAFEPNDGGLYYAIAITYQFKQNRDSATWYFDKAYLLNPDLNRAASK